MSRMRARIPRACLARVRSTPGDAVTRANERDIGRENARHRARRNDDRRASARVWTTTTRDVDLSIVRRIVGGGGRFDS